MRSRKHAIRPRIPGILGRGRVEFVRQGNPSHFGHEDPNRGVCYIRYPGDTGYEGRSNFVSWTRVSHCPYSCLEIRGELNVRALPYPNVRHGGYPRMLLRVFGGQFVHGMLAAEKESCGTAHRAHFLQQMRNDHHHASSQSIDETKLKQLT